MIDILYNAEITIAILSQELLFQLRGGGGGEVFPNTVIMFCVCTFLFSRFMFMK